MASLKVWDGSSWVDVPTPAASDHGLLTGLDSDDHTVYPLADGSRGFSATVSGVEPVDSDDLSTKNYVDNRGPRSITIEPLLDGENLTFFYSTAARTVTSVIPLLRGATASGTTWTIRYDPNRQAAGTELITGGTNTHSGTGGNSGQLITSFDNPNIPSGNYVWFETTTKSGIIDEFSITLI